MSDSIKTVLVIDDELTVRQSFVDYFEDHYWHVLQAESGEEALDMLEMASPDIAIVDIRLGGMSGDAFLREAYQRKPNMAFIICTGSPEYCLPGDIAALPQVCNRVFAKPVEDLAELNKTLHQQIEQCLALSACIG